MQYSVIYTITHHEEKRNRLQTCSVLFCKNETEHPPDPTRPKMPWTLGTHNFETIFDKKNTVEKLSTRAFQRYWSRRKRFHNEKVMIP